LIGRWTRPPEAEREEPQGFDAFELRLGDLMRGERATLGKSLLDVQRELKIKATYIAAIENADPSAFETPGFIAGYVRSYARYLGMDPEWAFRAFCTESGFSVAHGMSPAASGKKPSRRDPEAPRGDPLADPNAIFVPRGEALMSRIEPGALGSVAVLCLLIAGIGYGGWTVLHEIQKVQFAPVDQAPGVVAELEAIPSRGAGFAAGAEAGEGEGESGASRVAAAPDPEALDRLYRPQALDVPVLVARDGPIAALDPSTVGALADLAPRVPGVSGDVTRGPGHPGEGEQLVVAEGAPVGPADTPVQVVEPAAPPVMLLAVRPSWVRVSAADGTVLFEKILEAGERYVLPASEEPPLLRSGNAGAVYFAVNGEAYGPAGQGPSIVSNVALSPDAIREAYDVADLEKDAALAEYTRVAEATQTLIVPAEAPGGAATE